MEGFRATLPVILLLGLGASAGAAGSSLVDLRAAIHAQEAHVQMLQAKVEGLERPKRRAALLLGGHAAGRITPELDPVPDKAFFGPPKRADYPTDTRPQEKHHFGYPFPIIQDDDTYDSDYVKDENSDSGAWGAQFNYDRLRSKLQREKDALARAKREAEKDNAKVNHAQKKADDARSAADGERAKAEIRRNKQKEAEAAADSVTGSVGEKEVDVQKDVKDLEDCKSQLEAAKKALEELLKQKEEAEQKKAAAEDVAKGAKAKEEAAKKEEDKSEEELKEEQGEEGKAEKSYEEAKKDYTKTEQELNEAEKALRKHRGEMIDSKRSAAQEIGGGYDRDGKPCPKGCEKISSKGGAGAGKGAAAGNGPGARLLVGLLAVGLWRAAA